MMEYKRSRQYAVIYLFVATICTTGIDAFVAPTIENRKFAPATSWRKGTQLKSTDSWLIPDTDVGNSIRHSSATSAALDPLLSRILLVQDGEDEEDGVDLEFRTVMDASAGLSVWRSALLKGRLPIDADFEQSEPWPREPLFTPLTDAMAELQLPRFVLSHPDTVSAVLLSMIQLTTRFSERSKDMLEAKQQEAGDESDDDDDEYEWWEDLLEDKWTEYEDDDTNQLTGDEPIQEDSPIEVTLSEEEKSRLAFDIVASGLTDKWGGAITGVQALDHLFGVGHGLLDVQDNSNVGFGLNDGIWSHSGWKLLPSLQREIAKMPELRDLVQILGRRSTAQQSDSIRRFTPRKLDNEGALGAQYDPSRRTSIRGISLSGSLSEMLPSEALLLAQSKKEEDKVKPSQSALRRLFLAKMAESKLLSYESSGWQDVPSISVSKARYSSRLPSAPGGPIMICLDTSFSMMGRREQLSKALVLACVAAAHKQKREIQVVAFSSAQNTMETGPISADPEGVKRLLEFLSSSFGGGTDVTGALKHALSLTLGTYGHSSKENEESSDRCVHINDINQMSAADILLVTDGEIPDPPVSEEVMEALDLLKHRQGVQIHGLLVGKRSSVPLSKLCTHLHDFLLGYETAFATTADRSLGVTRSPTNALHFEKVASSGTISSHPSVFHRNRRYYGWNNHKFPLFGWNRRPLSVVQAKKRSGKKRSRFADDDDDAFLLEDSTHGYDERERGIDVRVTKKSASDRFTEQAQQVIDYLCSSVSSSLIDQRWQVSILDDEKASENSCWRYRGELQTAVERVADGLIERDEEARLVVLGMVSREHVLFLGPPGTAKSVLGRRLSEICGGQFFQRLLTRFTTPEEIFGPLSLRALENDEYKRKTDGFLPTASVAFLDEIFKANSAILNTLLTILNERQFDNGAGLREDCPIRCVVGASNELPESDELDALYDRFLIRKEVLPVSDEGVMRMLGMPQPGNSVCGGDATTDSAEKASACGTVFSDDLDKLIEAISTAADNVVMGDTACMLMRDLRTFMRDELDVDVSDRRLVKATRLLKISAACHGRKKVDPIDCLLLQHTMWRLPEERVALREWLWNHVTPGSSGLAVEDETLESAAKSSVRQFRVLLEGLRQEAIQAVRTTSGDVTGESGGRPADIAAIASIVQEASRIGTILQQRENELARHAELLRRCQDHLWLDPDEAQAARQLLLPRAEAFLKQVHRALEDAYSLARALSDGDKEGDAVVTNDFRVTVLECLWEDEAGGGITIEFSEEALSMPMKEAKAKYDLATFRKWKRAHRKIHG